MSQRHCVVLVEGLQVTLDDDVAAAFVPGEWAVRKIGNTRYLQCKRGEARRKFLHQLILPVAAGHVVDHINGDGLDNRRENLRQVSRLHNSVNKASPMRVLPRGVTQHKNGKFVARIKMAGKTTHLGMHATAEEAEATYKKWAELLYGKAAFHLSRE